jgi:type II secretory pathway pseudopilin PulG
MIAARLDIAFHSCVISNKMINQRNAVNRKGLTLIEIMIGLGMTLIILVAMMQAFRYASNEMSKGRAMIELSNQLQTAQDTLRRDLTNLTVDVKASAITSTPQGYFEYIEGPCRDATSIALNGTKNSIGDFDDILAFTTKSNGRSFRGRYQNQSYESNIAEVIWFADFEERDPPIDPGIVDYDESITLRRRVLLVRPELGVLGPNYSFLKNDISARFENGTWIANSLEDLAKRENRFGHLRVPILYQLDRAFLLTNRLNDTNLNPADFAFLGQDILLTDILSFDIKVFSPDCPVLLNNDIPTVPSDIGYSGANQLTAGAFVDLASAIGSASFQFGGPSAISYQMPNQLTGNANDIAHVYDTFSKHYESNNVDDNQNGTIDEGLDGFDSNGDGVIDDIGEREMRPPYPYPIRGIKVSFRIVERTTKQVRQTSLVVRLDTN